MEGREKTPTPLAVRTKICHGKLMVDGEIATEMLWDTFWSG